MSLVQDLITSFSHKLFSPKIVCALKKKEHFGSQYGGWDVATDYINLDSIIYSFGIGTDASFDSEIINRYQVVVHTFDPTPKSIDWVKKQDFSDNFILHEYGLADFDSFNSI